MFFSHFWPFLCKKLCILFFIILTIAFHKELLLNNYTNLTKNKHATTLVISKTGNKHDITLSLCKSFCIPKLLYCVESMNLNKTEKKRLGHPADRVLFRLFKTFDMSIINYCRQMFNFLPLEYVIDLYTLKFLVNCRSLNNSIINVIFNIVSITTINSIASLYDLDINNCNSWKYCIWKTFISHV